jgi:hypothetical protein
LEILGALALSQRPLLSHRQPCESGVLASPPHPVFQTLPTVPVSVKALPFFADDLNPSYTVHQ